MPSNVTSAIVFVVNSLAQLYLFVLLLRLWLPWLGADFRNPIAQAILKLTSPVVIPVRRIVPPVGTLGTRRIYHSVHHDSADPHDPGTDRRIRPDRNYNRRESCAVVAQVVRLRDYYSRHPELVCAGRLQSGDGTDTDDDRSHPETVPPHHPANGWPRYLADLCNYPDNGSYHCRCRPSAVIDLTNGRFVYGSPHEILVHWSSIALSAHSHGA